MDPTLKQVASHESLLMANENNPQQEEASPDYDITVPQIGVGLLEHQDSV